MWRCIGSLPSGVLLCSSSTLSTWVVTVLIVCRPGIPGEMPSFDAVLMYLVRTGVLLFNNVGVVP